MKIGFTGSQKNMSLEQFDVLYEKIEQINVSEAHHGDCIGSDATFHAICLEENIPVIIHPPKSAKKRAFCEGAQEILESKDYLIRNHDIVDACDVLFACPTTPDELRRSGTWATWRYAKKQGKVIFLILPDGKIR
jgi:hypothetical protein